VWPRQALTSDFGGILQAGQTLGFVRISHLSHNLGWNTEEVALEATQEEQRVSGKKVNEHRSISEDSCLEFNPREWPDNWIGRVQSCAPEELLVAENLREQGLGRGEAYCASLAYHRGGIVATDDKAVPTIIHRHKVPQPRDWHNRTPQ